MVRRPHHLLVSCSGPALVSASSSGTMISAVSPAAHSQITLRGHRVVPAQCSPGHCYGALPQTERHCSLGARQSLLQILLIHQVRSWLIFTRWFQITHSRSRWWDSGTYVVWNTIISYDKKYLKACDLKFIWQMLSKVLIIVWRQVAGGTWEHCYTWQSTICCHETISESGRMIETSQCHQKYPSQTHSYSWRICFKKTIFYLDLYVVLPRQLDCFHLANPELGWSVTIAMFFRTNINQTHWSFIIGNSVIYTATQSLNKSLEVASFFPQINIECLSLSSRARLSRVLSDRKLWWLHYNLVDISTYFIHFRSFR